MWGQSITVTAPTASQSISGPGFTFTCSLSSAPSAYTVQWLVDGEDWGLSQSPSICSFPTNTYFAHNSTQHTVEAVARDAFGNTVATSPLVTFTTANSYPNSNPITPSYLSLSISTSIATSSTWSGFVTITPSVSGTNTGDNKQIVLFIDGIPGGINDTYTQTTTGTPAAFTVDTTTLSNGAHLFQIVGADMSVISGEQTPFGQWGALVNVQNNSMTVHGTATGMVYWGIDPIALTTSATPALASSSSNSGSGTTLTCGPIASTTGHSIFVWSQASPSGANVSSVTDTAGNSYSQMSRTTAGLGSRFGAWWSALNITGRSSNTLTITFNSSVANSQVECLEYSNISSIDVNGSTAANSSTVSGNGLPESLPFPLSGSNELVLAAVMAERNVTNFTVNPALPVLVSQTQSAVAGAVVGNVVSPNELVITPREFYIDSVSPTTQQLTSSIRNADGSITANANVIWASTTPTVCTISSSGLVAYAGFGACNITASGGGGLALRSIWGWAGTNANNVLNYGTDGKAYAGYTPGKSYWSAGMFFSTGSTGGPSAFYDIYLTPQQFANFYSQGYRNVIEATISTTWGSSESNFHTLTQSYLTSLQTNSQLVTPNFIVHGISSYCGSNENWPGIFQNPGPGTTYATPGWTYLAQQWSSMLPGSIWSQGDEISDCWGNPAPHAQIALSSACSTNPSVDCLTQISCNGTTCTVNWQNWSAESVFIHGATTNSCLNMTVGSTIVKATNTGTSTFTFPESATSCTGTITATATTDPNLVIENMIDQWEASNTQYFAYTGLVTMRNWITAGGAGAYPLMNWSPKAFSGTRAQYAFCGNPAIGDGCDMYYSTCGNRIFTPLHGLPVNCSINDAAVTFRNYWTSLQAPRLFLAQTLGTNINYGYQGYTVNITSISGNTVTFSSPICGSAAPYPGFLCNIIPDVTRGWITGTSGTNASYYGVTGTPVNWFIDSCPTSTSCTISRAASTDTSTTANSGTITFPSGDTLTSSTITAEGGQSRPMTWTTNNCINAQDLGVIFTVSGTSDSYFTSNRFWTMRNAQGNTGAACRQGGQQPQVNVREVPPASYAASGGSMTILANNDAKFGVNAISNQVRVGARAVFMSSVIPLITMAPGVRQYGLGKTWDWFQSGVWGPSSPESFFQDTKDLQQAQLHPYWSVGDADQTTPYWYTATINMLAEGKLKYLFQPLCSGGAPDPGAQFEVTARCGTYGNMLLVANVSDYAQTRAVPLASVAVSGQACIRYLGDGRGVDVSVLSVGATTDTPAIKEAGFVMYVCSKNEAAEIQQPMMSVRIADVPNATQAVVRYAYEPFLLPLRYDNFASPGNLPLDRTLGPLYYQILYLGANNKVLAVSDVQKQ